MKKLTLCCVMALLCLNFWLSISIKAQERNALNTETLLKPLSIGQKIPLLIYEQAMPVLQTKETEGDSLRLSAFKGKFVLLDFWATWCSSCIYKFPKLDSLQQKYAKDLAIILVNTKSTKDRKENILAMLSAKLAPFKASSLPTIYADTLLNRLFPHAYLPHYVWIGKNGELKLISDSSLLTEHTLTALIEEDYLKQKKSLKL